MKPNKHISIGCALVAILLLTPCWLYGQQVDADALLGKARSVRSQHPDSARYYTELLFDAFKEVEPDSSQLFAIINTANLRRYMNDFARAREVLSSVRQYAEQPGNEKQLAFLYQILGIIDNQQGRYQSASENFLRGMHLYDTTGDSLNKAVLLKELGIVHERLKLNDLALQYGKDALRVIRSIGDSSMIAGFLGDIGTMHQNMGKLDEALPYQLESLSINRKIGQDSDLPFNYHNIGDIYMQMGILDSAEVYTMRAYEGFEKFDLKFAGLYSLMNLGMLNMEKGKFQISEDYLLRSYNRAKEFDGLYEQGMLLEKLSVLNERMGRYSAALNYLKDSHTIRDSLMSADRERTILEMAESYKNDQSTQEIERLRMQKTMSERLITMQQVFLIVVSIVLIAFLGALLMMIRANKNANRLNRELLQANARLTNMGEERNNLIHVMAHDLRTPLAQVSGLSELLKDSDNVTDEHLEYINLIDTASRNGLSLIAQMMESSNNKSFASAREFEEVDLHRIIDSSLSLYEAQARNKNIRMVFENEAQNPIVHSDPQAIRRVIDNLVSNAIKYTYHDTQVLVTLKGETGGVEICVKDNGPGFSDADKLLLFRKFTTLSARPTGNESSTGLGLAIVYDLLNEINGSINLEEDGEPGAHFCVKIPRNLQSS